MSNAIITCPVRVSFAHLFTPKAYKGGTPYYQITAFFLKSDKEQMDCLKTLVAAAEQVKQTKWGGSADAPRTPLVGTAKSPVKDADTYTDESGIPYLEKYPNFAGMYFIRLSNSKPVPVIARYVDQNKNPVILTDPSSIYSGCYCKINLNPYVYQNKGITFGLNGVQFYGDAERWGGGPPSVTALFEVEEAPESGFDNPNNYGQTNTDPFAANNEESPF